MIRLIYLLFLLLPAMLSAATLTLQEILDLAEKQNHEIKLARADLDYAGAQRQEAISNALPHVEVGVGYNRNFLENIFYFTVTDSAGRPVTQSFKASFRNEYRLNATLSQTIYSFGKIGSAIQVAGYYRHFTQHQFSSEWQRIITEVKKAFYRALLAQKVLEVSRESENSARENYLNFKTKYDAGAVSEFDLLQAEVRWENSIPDTMQAHKNYRLAINSLKSIIDFPLREELILEGNLEQFPPLPEVMDMDSIFSRRPDYNMLLWEKRMREKRVTMEFANHLPTLAGNLTYTYGAQSDRFALDNDNDNIILGISLNIPIFSGGYTSAQVQKAKIDVKKVGTQIQMANDNIRIEIQNLILRMREAYQRIQAAQKSVNTARRAFEIAQTRVENGLATQLELKDSRVFLDRSLLNYYSAIYDYLESRFELERAQGKVRKEVY
ncbi:MAG: TolC family protein [Calditrichia bacterium]